SPRSPTPPPWPCTPDWSVDRGLSRNRRQSSGRQDLDYSYVSDNIVVCATGVSALWSVNTRTVFTIEDGSPPRYLRTSMKTTNFPPKSEGRDTPTTLGSMWPSRRRGYLCNPSC